MNNFEITEKVNELANAWEEFKNVDKNYTKSNDPLDFVQLNKIENKMDECKARLDLIETSIKRPEMDYDLSFESDTGYKDAFVDYIRTGNERNLEHKSLVANSDNEGGFLVARPVVKTINKLIEELSPFRKLASIDVISTDHLEILEDLEEFGAGWTSEIGDRTTSKTSKLNKKKIHIHELYAQPKATQRLIDDASINIETWIAGKLSDAFAKLENHAFINGDGQGKPKGILSYEEGREWGKIAQRPTLGKGVSADDLSYLLHSLSHTHASRATFVMHRDTISKLRLTKDMNGMYLWQPSLIAGAPNTIMGVPVVQIEAMPDHQPDNIVVIAADFKAAYRIVDRQGIKILRDPFTEKPFVKFYATKRVGGDVVNFDAVKLLKLAK